MPPEALDLAGFLLLDLPDATALKVVAGAVSGLWLSLGLRLLLTSHEVIRYLLDE